MMWASDPLFYHWTMLQGAAAFVMERIRRKSELIPLGITWASLISVDVTVVAMGISSLLRRIRSTTKATAPCNIVQQ